MNSYLFFYRYSPNAKKELVMDNQNSNTFLKKNLQFKDNTRILVITNNGNGFFKEQALSRAKRVSVLDYINNYFNFHDCSLGDYFVMIIFYFFIFA